MTVAVGMNVVFKVLRRSNLIEKQLKQSGPNAITVDVFDFKAKKHSRLSTSKI